MSDRKVTNIVKHGVTEVGNATADIVAGLVDGAASIADMFFSLAKAPVEETITAVQKVQLQIANAKLKKAELQEKILKSAKEEK
jgi:hypothetical protein